MLRILLAVGILVLCRTAIGGDLTLEQLKARLPAGTILNLPLGSVLCVQGSLVRDFEAPADQRKTPNLLLVDALGDPKMLGALSALGIGYYIEIRGAKLDSQVRYTFEGYETGEFIRRTGGDDPKAEPALRYHPFFVVTKVISPASKP